MNETSATKVFFAKDSHIFGIQEAIDTTGSMSEWRPIEMQAPDFCGNGDFGVKVRPGEFVMFIVPKYRGELKRAMRIRLQVGESLYISRSYDGSISDSQFNITKKLGISRNGKTGLPIGNFFGAIPREFNRH